MFAPGSKSLPFSRLFHVLLLLFAVPGPVSAHPWHAEVAPHLQAHLAAEEQVALATFFGDTAPLPGPLNSADTTDQQLRSHLQRWGVNRLSEVVVTPALVPQAAIAGQGTAEDPYRGLIAAVIAHTQTRGVLLRIPAGYYQEAGLDVPDRTWLFGDPGAVLVAPADVRGVPYLVSVRGMGGVVGLTLDGSAVPYDWSQRWHQLNGIQVRESLFAVVADNVIRDMPGFGVFGREAGEHGVLVLNNTLERIGHCGIRTQANWLVVNNRIHHAGIHAHGEGGLGHDGIILYGSGTRVVHNLIVAERRPNGRHGIAAQSASDNVVENNVVVVAGELRGAINFSDGSHRNRVRRNLVLGTAVDRGQVTNAIRMNGQSNEVRENALFFTRNGINTAGWPTASHNRIHDNHLAATETALLTGPFDQEAGNTTRDAAASR